MRERSFFKALVLSFLITFSVAIIVVLIELLRSTSLSMTSGISVVAGGFGDSFIILLFIGLCVLFLLTYFWLKPKKLSK